MEEEINSERMGAGGRKRPYGVIQMPRTPAFQVARVTSFPVSEHLQRSRLCNEIGNRIPRDKNKKGGVPQESWEISRLPTRKAGVRGTWITALGHFLEVLALPTPLFQKRHTTAYRSPPGQCTNNMLKAPWKYICISAV